MRVPGMPVPQPHPPLPQLHSHTAMQPPPMNYQMNCVPMDGPGGIPQQSGGIPQPQPGMMSQGMMHVPPPGSGMDSPSTHMTDLMTTPGGSQSSGYTGVISPAGGNPPLHHERVRPHNLPPIYGNGGGGDYPHTGETSRMYCNDDVRQGEQVDFRQAPMTGIVHQPPFTNIRGEDVICGQGMTLGYKGQYWGL